MICDVIIGDSRTESVLLSPITTLYRYASESSPACRLICDVTIGDSRTEFLECNCNLPARFLIAPQACRGQACHKTPLYRWIVYVYSIYMYMYTY